MTQQTLMERVPPPQASTPIDIDCGRLRLRYVRNKLPAKQRNGAFEISYDGERVGSVSLVETAPRHADIGYAIIEEFRERGFASKAVAAVLAVAPGFGFHTLSAQCRSNNVASRRILEKTGFTLSSTAPYWTNATAPAGGHDASLLFMVYQWFAAVPQLKAD